MPDFVFNVSRLLAQVSGAHRAEPVEAPRQMLDVPELVGPVCGEACLTRLEDAVLVSGCMCAVVRVPCSRCNEDLDTEVQFELNDEFVPVIDQARDLSAEVGDRWMLDPGNTLDLRGVLAEGVISSIPLRVVCSEGCEVFHVDVHSGDPQPDPRLVELKRLRDEMFPEDGPSHG